MDADAYIDSIEASMITQLDRLSSSKSLIALTDASLDRGPVLTVAAGREKAAADAYEGWAANGDDGSMFRAAADRHRGNYEAILDLLDGDTVPAAATEPMHASLADRKGELERAAALVGRSLVDERVDKQVVGFFVHQADQVAADCFRDICESHDDSRDDGVQHLAAVCETDGEWERAAAVTEETIQLAYDHYVETLEAMGVNPKPVC